MTNQKQPVDIPLEGELNCWSRGFDLPDLLLSVCKTGKTGMLRFVNSEAEKTLFLKDGEIIFAKSSSEDDRLGEYLLREGKISLQDLEKCTHFVKPGKRLGTILVEHELLGPKELVQAVMGQVRAIALSLFRWTEAWYGFDEMELPSKETITLDMPTSQLILDGVKLIDSWRRITRGLGGMSSVYRRITASEDVLGDLELDAASRAVLDNLGRPKSVAEACTDSVLGDLEVCRLMWVFRSFGWLEKVDGVEAQSAIGPSAGDPEAAPVLEDTTVTPVEVAAEPRAPDSSPTPAEEESSFEIVEGEMITLPEAGEPAEATPTETGTIDEPPSTQGPELSPVDPPVAAPASLADIAEPPGADPQPMVTEPEVDLGGPFVSGEPEVIVDLGDSPGPPPSDPVIDLGEPPNPAGLSLEAGPPHEAEQAPAIESTPEVDDQPVFSGLEDTLSDPAAPVSEAVPKVEEKPIAPVEAEVPSGPSLDVEGSKGSLNRGRKVEPVVDADDMDLEGLGMILGNESEE